MSINIKLPARTVTAISVNSVTDYPAGKTAEASVTLTFSDGATEPRGLTLWSGADYDDAGQWTDTDVLARAVEILSA